MTRSSGKPHSIHFDFIVIGGGSGGYAAARTARETCQRVAIVDSAPELGGLCILRGCMPSKTLIYSAEVLHHARHGADLGLHIPSARADMPALHRRKREIIREFAEYRQHQLQSERFTLFRNRAVIVSPDAIELDDGTRLTADHFLIATGSVVATPAVPGLDGLPCWTSDDVLDLDFIPGWMRKTGQFSSNIKSGRLFREATGDSHPPQTAHQSLGYRPVRVHEFGAEELDVR